MYRAVLLGSLRHVPFAGENGWVARAIGSADARSCLEASVPTAGIGTVVGSLGASCRRHLEVAGGSLVVAVLGPSCVVAVAVTVPAHCGWYMRLELRSFARWDRRRSQTCLSASWSRRELETMCATRAQDVRGRSRSRASVDAAW